LSCCTKNHYLSFFYVSIKQKRNDQLIKPYKKKQYTIKKTKNDNSYHFNILQRDRRAKQKKDQAKKNEEQQAQDIHAINYPFEHFLTDEQLTTL
jgi:hypothetical protein